MKQKVTFNIDTKASAGDIEVTDKQGNYVKTIDLATFTMDGPQASKLIEDVVDLCIEATRQAIMRKRGVTKRTIKEVDASVTKLFKALTGRNPTKTELSKITD